VIANLSIRRFITVVTLFLFISLHPHYTYAEHENEFDENIKKDEEIQEQIDFTNNEKIEQSKQNLQEEIEQFEQDLQEDKNKLEKIDEDKESETKFDNKYDIDETIKEQEYSIKSTIQTTTTQQLTNGDSGKDVKEFKRKLVQLGFATWSNPSENYGPITAGVVKKFQEAYGLKADGVAREDTINKVNSLIKEGRFLNGDKGPHVKELKQKLVQLGFATWKNPSESYGPITARVVKSFQKEYGLIVSGVVNKVTENKINEILDPPYRPGDQGQPVIELKKKLVQLGFASWTNPSPNYGKHTANRVKYFQRAYGLSVDGIAGTETINKLDELLKSGKFQNGDKGKHVVDLKKKLVRIGFANWKKPSQNYGAITSRVVEDFQSYYGLPVSGVANKATLNKIDEILDSKFTTGKSGNEVVTLKKNLTKLGFGSFPKKPSKKYGAITEKVVTDFQRHYKLKVNGIADSVTLAKIDQMLSSRYRNGQSGDHVVQLKKDLNLFGMGFPSNPSNKYGKVTEGKVKDFQRLYNLPVSGIADEITLKTIKNNITKIFIDPGHGGTDPGALGLGLREKNLTLDIAKKIEKRLKNRYIGVDVRLSRTGDQTLSLEKRSSTANSWKPDLFISVHINAGGGRGFESYIHNGNVSNATVRYQNTIHDHIVKQMKFTDRGKKRANFHVLRETNMPAILFEYLFIDNGSDNNLLSQSSYRTRLGNATADGVAKALKLKRK